MFNQELRCILDSFRNRVLFIFAGLTIILGICVSLYIGNIASQHLAKASGQTLHVAAKNISNALATSLAEREREMVLLSQSPFFSEANLDGPRVRTRLEQVKNAYVYYAWMGVTDLNGDVQIAADGILEGENVSSRPWFKAGLQGTYLGDVHEAVLLAKKIQALNPHEPMRFIDFATPIYDPNTQKLKGVLAAHADWEWARHILNKALSQTASQRGIEVFILNKQGELLYPFKSIGRVKPPQLQVNDALYYIDDWNEGQDFLTTNIAVESETESDIGWHVVIRQPLAIALADMRDLQFKIFLIGLFVSLFIFYVIYQLANKLSRPIEALAKSAYAVEQGDVHTAFHSQSSIREIQGLSHSLQSMTQTLLEQKQQLLEANQSLERKVQERTRALELANLELIRLSRHDALTGLHNRRALNEQLEYWFAQHKRNQIGYAALILDVDYFKQVNDQYGHDQGDQVLQQVAKIIDQATRETDFVARYGGEEFVILLPATHLMGAQILAEKIRTMVERAVILAEKTLTVSIGVSVTDLNDTDAYAILKRADRHLYQAKTNGRNQTVIDA